MDEIRPYRPDICAYCQNPTWCEIRANGKPQCRACEVERFFEYGLFPAFGYRMVPWIRNALRKVYGTLKPNGDRLYRRAYICIPKKNYKSTLAGGLTAYHLWKHQPSGKSAKFYGLASAKDQAGIVYEAARDYINRVPDLRARIRHLDSSRRLLRRDNSVVYEVIAADGGKRDGIEPVFAVVDELHRWVGKKAEALFSILTKGTVSLDDSLIWEITTMGEEHESPLWYAEHEYARQVISGALVAETFYAAIYSADEKRILAEPEYWKSREARVAANPSHEDNGGFLKDERLVEELEAAIAKPQLRPDYLRFHLNVPAGEGHTPVVDLALWAQGGGGVDLRQWPDYDVHLLLSKWGLVGRSCVVGIDLAWTTDMAALALLFPPLLANELWHVLLFFWLPEERIAHLERRTRAPLDLWRRQGFLSTTPGAEIDMKVIVEKVKWASQLFNVREVTLDRWGGLKAAASLFLIPEGFMCIDVPQTFAGLSAATKAFMGLYMSKQLAHGNNPIFNWHVGCLSLKSDGGDNVKPIKPPRDTASKRIDGVAATVMALSRAAFLAPQSTAAIEVW